MKEKIIEIVAKSSNFLEACTEHRIATAEAKRHNDGSWVSPMTHKAGIGYVYELHIPEPEPMSWDSGEHDEPEADGDPEVAVRSQALASLNSSDILRETANLLEDDNLGSPLVQQIEAWLSDSMTAIDPTHLPMREYAAVGRHVLSLAAAVLERRLQVAVGQLSDARF
jgi:hypothetical protein